MPSLIFKCLSLLLLAASVLGLAFAAAAVQVPVAARLGRRGAQRRLSLERGGSFGAMEPAIRFLAGVVALLPLSGLRARQELELRRADYCLGLTPDEYSALSLLAAVGLGGTVALLTRLAGSSAVLAIPATAFGLVLPALQVHEIIRRRVKEVVRGLPHAIEIAAMCMGAGLDFPGALRMLTQGHAGKRNALADEFAAILEELDLGHTRREALLSFAERVQAPAVRDFVNAVVQAEQKGNPLAKVIQIQGRMLNSRRSVAAEEAAARAGVLLIAPMVLLVACVMLLLMGPFLSKGLGF
jgi:tight adherence protein C